MKGGDAVGTYKTEFCILNPLLLNGNRMSHDCDCRKA